MLAQSSEELDVPRDLEFHPDRSEELWVANRATATIVVVCGGSRGVSIPSSAASNDTAGNPATWAARNTGRFDAVA